MEEFLDVVGRLVWERKSLDHFRLFCPVCHQPGDLVDARFMTWAVRRGEHSLCIDCDREGGDQVRSVLIAEDLSEYLRIGDCIFWTQKPWEWKAFGVISGAVGACLVLPYLDKSGEENGK